jgi:ribonucleotide reductase alpha subunit
VSLPKYVYKDENGKPHFNFERLIEITRIITRNLNRVIDQNLYPVPEARYSNMKNRPIGIGVQGLADAFQRMRLCFESEEAAALNEKIFETIYYGAVLESIQLAKEEGAYGSFPGSPASKGILQFDMWNHVPTHGGYDW